MVKKSENHIENMFPFQKALANEKKSEQVIIRLPKEVKQKLQNVADNLGIDMSKLVRNKIDEIITEHALSSRKSKLEELKSTQASAYEKLIEELFEGFKGSFKQYVNTKINEEIQKEIDDNTILDKEDE